MIISSRQNPKVKEIVRLRQRKEERQRQRLMIVDGYDEIVMALGAHAVVVELYYCPDVITDKQRLALLQESVLENTTIFKVSLPVFEKITYRESPDGWLAICRAIPTELSGLQLGAAPLVLVCEAVEKPGNLGAILRTAFAAGVDAVIAVDAVTDWTNPNIIRSSRGAIFGVPVAETTHDELYDWLKKHNISIVATTPHTKLRYTEADLTQGVAICMGTERQGLSDFWLTKADIKTYIPMQAGLDSLNVSTSAAILLYEAVRQRSS